MIRAVEEQRQREPVHGAGNVGRGKAVGREEQLLHFKSRQVHVGRGVRLLHGDLAVLRAREHGRFVVHLQDDLAVGERARAHFERQAGAKHVREIHDARLRAVGYLIPLRKRGKNAVQRRVEGSHAEAHILETVCGEPALDQRGNAAYVGNDQLGYGIRAAHDHIAQNLRFVQKQIRLGTPRAHDQLEILAAAHARDGLLLIQAVRKVDLRFRRVCEALPANRRRVDTSERVTNVRGVYLIGILAAHGAVAVVFISLALAAQHHHIDTGFLRVLGLHFHHFDHVAAAARVGMRGDGTDIADFQRRAVEGRVNRILSHNALHAPVVQHDGVNAVIAASVGVDLRNQRFEIVGNRVLGEHIVDKIDQVGAVLRRGKTIFDHERISPSVCL